MRPSGSSATRARKSIDRSGSPLPLIAALGILVNGGLMLSLGRDNWIRLIVWLSLGLTIDFAYSRYHTKLGRSPPPRNRGSRPGIEA